MILRSSLQRCLNNYKIFTSSITCQSKPVCDFETCRLHRLIIVSSRCYSNSKSNGTVNQTATPEMRESKYVEEEETLEVLDVEKERRKLRGGDLSSKYTIFKDEDSPIILDVEEEKLAAQRKALTDTSHQNEYEGISMIRGTRGVFDTRELVAILKDQSALDIVVLKIPSELSYADHMVIVSSKSSRHMAAMAAYVRRLFKMKRHRSDQIPIIEGKRTNNDSWLSLDLGNIILHLFADKTREKYDLESLWALGPEFDPHLHEESNQDKLSVIMEKHSMYLKDLEPADAK